MRQRLRVLQVGCGGRAQRHLESMVESGAVEIVALCELDADRLAATGERFGVARRYRDMGEAIRAERPDLVDIVTPPHIRAGIVAQAIDAGAPAVLIEKPIALTPSESRAVAALGRDRLIAVNTQYQWMPHWRRFWALLAEGGLGQVRHLRASTRANLLEQGPHILDLALRAAAASGLPAPEWVLAACAGVERYASTPIPADTAATIGLGAVRLQLNAGPSAPEVPGERVIWFQQQVEVVGDRGRLWVSLNQGWQLWLDGQFEAGPTEWPLNDGEAQAALFTELRDTLLAGGDAWRAFPTRVEVAAQISDLMFGCYASALGGGRVALPGDWPDSLIDAVEGLADRR
jgi:predicted dehydrogenase